MTDLPYTTASDPVRIAHDAIRAPTRTLTAAERAAQAAVDEAVDQAGWGECLTEGIVGAVLDHAARNACPHGHHDLDDTPNELEN